MGSSSASASERVPCRRAAAVPRRARARAGAWRRGAARAFAAAWLAAAWPGPHPAWAGDAAAPGAGTAGQVAAEVAAAAPATADAGLSALLAGMRSTSGVVAHFTERKELALLSSPLECEGTISFVPPGRLVREVVRPARSRLVVDGRAVRIEEAGSVRAFDLEASPVARQLIDSFVVLFNGDEARLRELYDATFTGSPAGWTLGLVPRSMPLSRMIASFELAGRQARIDRMVASEPDGDRTVTIFGETDSAHRFAEAELEALFGPGPAR